MFKKYYLAYGSNLNLNQIKDRCPSAKLIGTTKLNDYRLVYKGVANDFSYLTIEEYQGSNVPLGLYELSYFDMFSLDNYEGYPTFYSKYYIPIKIGDKNIKAFIYVMNQKFDYHLPSVEYIETCMEGYDDFGFDKSILEKALTDTIDNLSKVKRK